MTPKEKKLINGAVAKRLAELDQLRAQVREWFRIRRHHHEPLASGRDRILRNPRKDR